MAATVLSQLSATQWRFVHVYRQQQVTPWVWSKAWQERFSVWDRLLLHVTPVIHIALVYIFRSTQCNMSWPEWCTAFMRTKNVVAVFLAAATWLLKCYFMLSSLIISYWDVWSDFIIKKRNGGDGSPSVWPEADHDLPEVSWFLPDCFRSPGGLDGLQLAAAGPVLHTASKHTQIDTETTNQGRVCIQVKHYTCRWTSCECHEP